jgi:hypothetical protein
MWPVAGVSSGWRPVKDSRVYFHFQTVRLTVEPGASYLT